MINPRQPLQLGCFASALLLLAACNYNQPQALVKPSAEALAALPQQAAVPATKREKTLADEVQAQGRAGMAPEMSVEYVKKPSTAEITAPMYTQENHERYQNIADSPVHAVAEQPVSTFSIDVDTGGYANVRRLLNQGQLPPAGAVRLEEMLNYFPYRYPQAKPGDGPFAVSTEVAVTPWNTQSRLLRIAIKADDLSVESLPPVNLVFLVDVSGSMQRPDGLPLVQSSLRLLTEQLRPEDKVSLVAYAGAANVVLEPTSGADKATIRAAIERLQAGGATAGASAIKLAYQQAQQGKIGQGINRILLATDGDFNVGISDFDSLKTMVVKQHQSGITLTTLGYGSGNYNEHLMEQLADAGNGNYAYIDTLREARKVLVEQLGSTLSVVASDVKIQVEFNPAHVSEYRLLGYENRALNREDFNNDNVDAGEIGAGHRVTALYEVIPVGNQGWLEPLRYQAQIMRRSSVGEAAELAWLRIRYKPAQQSTSRLLEQPIAVTNQVPSIEQASQDLQFASAVAAFAQQLKGGQYTGKFDLPATARLARMSKGADELGLRAEFVQLVELAQSLSASIAPALPPTARID